MDLDEANKQLPNQPQAKLPPLPKGAYISFYPVVPFLFPWGHFS